VVALHLTVSQLEDIILAVDNRISIVGANEYLCNLQDYLKTTLAVYKDEL